MTEPTLAPSGPASVVLDIGGDIGALILSAPLCLAGAEIEISPNGCADAPRTHSRVRARRLGARVEFAAVYPGLLAGEYTIWRDAGTPLATITIKGGQLTHHSWPAKPAGVPPRPTLPEGAPVLPPILAACQELRQG
jgi:hypothetical protein